jgi:hypothetical protein
MQLLARKNAAIVFAMGLILVSLSIANYVGWLRLKPEVSAVGWIADKPDYSSHLVNTYQRAMDRAQGSKDSFLPIYDVQNPGFFLLVAELYTRAGATTPLPLEITSIVLFDIGAICFFFWVYVLFSDLMVAAFGTAFLALSQFFLFFPGVTHTFPYEFVFFNITMLLYVLFLRSNKRVYLVGALIAMFMTCMNYWFYYMSSWIIMIGLWWQYRGRPRIRDVAMISAPPIAAAGLTAIMVMALSGGVVAGFLRIADIFVARTFDARIPGGTWYPNQRFMTAQDWLNYPWTVISKLEWAYTFDFRWFAIAAVCTFILLWFRNRRSLLSALILLLGGFSWYYVMFQHTHIHHFVGQYSFMAICPIFGLIVSETISFTRDALRRASTVGIELADLAKQRPGMANRESSVVINRARWAAGHIAVAVLLLVVGWKMALPYAKHTYGLLRDTVQISRAVETKYQEAVQTICRKHPEITLADLKAASKDWGFEWRPELITETNRTPKCSG